MNIENIAVIVLGVLFIIYIIWTDQAAKWLRYAVSVAEQKFGSGTGKLKLAAVYDMFISKYPMFSKIMPYFAFETMVDLALEWMKLQMNNNPKFKDVIEK